jgi:hypothetical protein
VTDRADVFALTSKKGWPKVTYDREIWIPCPPGFSEQMTRAEWARGFATLWWDASGLKHGKRQVRNMEEGLIEVQERIYATLLCHTALIHLPNVDVTPLPVCLAVWQAIGDRDTQLRELVHADEPMAVETPLVEPVTTDKLGTGLKSQYLQRERAGSELFGAVNYAWRVEELETDLRVFTAGDDLGRLQGAMPDIDELTRQISIEPL